jgi:hypothetical protein
MFWQDLYNALFCPQYMVQAVFANIHITHGFTPEEIKIWEILQMWQVVGVVAVRSQSISSVCPSNSQVAFYDIHRKKDRCNSFVMSRTPRVCLCLCVNTRGVDETPRVLNTTINIGYIFYILDTYLRSLMAPRSVRFGVRSRKLSNIGRSLNGWPKMY